MEKKAANGQDDPSIPPLTLISDKLKLEEMKDKLLEVKRGELQSLKTERDEIMCKLGRQQQGPQDGEIVVKEEMDNGENNVEGTKEDKEKHEEGGTEKVLKAEDAVEEEIANYGDEECDDDDDDDENEPPTKRLKRSGSLSHKKKGRKKKTKSLKKQAKEKEDAKPRESWLQVINSLPDDALLSGYERVLERANTLSSKKMWLPSIEARQAEPIRRKAHWDMLLDEMSWLAEDFTCERKWKMAVASRLACQCAIVVRLRQAHAKREYFRKRRIASTMSNAVMAFWESANAIAASVSASDASQDGRDSAYQIQNSVTVHSIGDLDAQVRSIEAGESVAVSFFSKESYGLLAGCLVAPQKMPEKSLVVMPRSMVASLQARSAGTLEDEWKSRRVCVISFENLIGNFDVYKSVPWDLCAVVSQSGEWHRRDDGNKSFDKRIWLRFVNTILEAASKRVFITDKFTDAAKALFTFKFDKHVTFSIEKRSERGAKINFVQGALTPLQRELLRSRPPSIRTIRSINLHPCLVASSPCGPSVYAEQLPLVLSFENSVYNASSIPEFVRFVQLHDSVLPAIRFKHDRKLSRISCDQKDVPSPISVEIPSLCQDATIQNIVQPRVVSVLNSKCDEYPNCGEHMHELLNVSSAASSRVLKNFVSMSGKTMALQNVLREVREQKVLIVAQSAEGQEVAKCILGSIGINFVCSPSGNMSGEIADMYLNSLCVPMETLAIITSAKCPGSMFNVSGVHSIIIFDYDLSSDSIYSIMGEIALMIERGDDINVQWIYLDGTAEELVKAVNIDDTAMEIRKKLIDAASGRKRTLPGDIGDLYYGQVMDLVSTVCHESRCEHFLGSLHMKVLNACKNNGLATPLSSPSIPLLSSPAVPANVSERNEHGIKRQWERGNDNDVNDNELMTPVYTKSLKNNEELPVLPLFYCSSYGPTESIEAVDENVVKPPNPLIDEPYIPDIDPCFQTMTIVTQTQRKKVKEPKRAGNALPPAQDLGVGSEFVRPENQVIRPIESVEPINSGSQDGQKTKVAKKKSEKKKPLNPWTEEVIKSISGLPKNTVRFAVHRVYEISGRKISTKVMEKRMCASSAKEPSKALTPKERLGFIEKLNKEKIEGAPQKPAVLHESHEFILRQAAERNNYKGITPEHLVEEIFKKQTLEQYKTSLQKGSFNDNQLPLCVGMGALAFPNPRMRPDVYPMYSSAGYIHPPKLVKTYVSPSKSQVQKQQPQQPSYINAMKPNVINGMNNVPPIAPVASVASVAPIVASGIPSTVPGVPINVNLNKIANDVSVKTNYPPLKTQPQPQIVPASAPTAEKVIHFQGNIGVPPSEGGVSQSVVYPPGNSFNAPVQRYPNGIPVDIKPSDKGYEICVKKDDENKK